MRNATRSIVTLSLAAFALSACYVLPVAPDGSVYLYPAAPAAPALVAPAPVAPAYPPPPPAAPMPAQLSARLYPANDIASQVGMVSGTVTNMMNGKGRFQLNYKGELLAGEATRVDGDSRRGVASAYGQSGTFMSCEYQMNNPRQGAGTCAFSDGARYQVHIGG